jgi:hypothetical protein
MGLFDAIFGGGDDSGFKEANNNIAKNRALLDAIDLPQYQEFNPELYDYQSANFETLSEDPLLRSQQIQILNKMAGLSETGLSDVDAAGFQQARDDGAQMARAGRESAMRDAVNRGVGGSGLEFALREMGNQGGAQAAQQAGLGVAAESARGRQAYLKAFGDATGQMRDQDMRLESANKGIINEFNRLNTQGRNQAMQGNVDARNSAFQYNQGLKDKRFNNEMSKATGQMNLNNQQTDIALAKEEQKRRQRGALMGTVGAGVGAAVTGGSAQGAGLGYTIGSGI